MTADNTFTAYLIGGPANGTRVTKNRDANGLFPADMQVIVNGRLEPYVILPGQDSLTVADYEYDG